MRRIELNMLTPIFSQAELDAIAYLTTWAYSSYEKVNIFQEQGGNIMATYHNAEKNSYYVIGAILDSTSKTYTFHS